MLNDWMRETFLFDRTELQGDFACVNMGVHKHYNQGTKWAYGDFCGYVPLTILLGNMQTENLVVLLIRKENLI